MGKLDGCFSHVTDDYRTPSVIYNYFMNKGFLDLFPYCSNHDQYEELYDDKRLFINPPYSHINSDRFYDYLVSLLKRDNLIVLLIPSRTDTKFFNKISKYCWKYIFLTGRLHFNDGKNGAPFPSVLMYLDNRYIGDFKHVLFKKVDDFNGNK